MKNIMNINASSIQITKQTKQRIFSIAYRLLRLFLLVAVGYTVMSPLFQVIANSLKPQSDFINSSVVWIPSKVHWQNFADAFRVMDYPVTFLRTLLIPVVSALMEVATCGVAAYSFARFKYPERKVMYALLILLILVPVRITMLPSYVNYRYFDFFGITKLIGKLVGKDLTLNLINTPFTFYLPSIFGVGYQSGLFIMIYIQFLKGIPKELEEAAWIDGAGPVKTFIQIIVPSSGVAILTVSILSIIWHWNEYYLTGLYFNSNYPMSIAIDRIFELIKLDQHVSSQIGTSMAACLLFILPVLIFYLIVQKNFIKSIDRVGIVG